LCTFSAQLSFLVLSESSGGGVGLGEVDACVKLDDVDTYQLVFSTAMYESNYTDLDLQPHWLVQSFLGLAMVD